MEENEKVDVTEEVKFSNEQEIEESKIGEFIFIYVLNSILYSVALGIFLVGFIGSTLSGFLGQVTLKLSGSEGITTIIMELSYLTISIIATILVVKFATKDAMKKNVILPKDEQKVYGILVSIFAMLSIIGILTGIINYFNVDVEKIRAEELANRKTSISSLFAPQKSDEQILSEAKRNLLLSVFSNLGTFAILVTVQKKCLHKQIEAKNIIK